MTTEQLGLPFVAEEMVRRIIAKVAFAEPSRRFATRAGSVHLNDSACALTYRVDQNGENSPSLLIDMCAGLFNKEVHK